MEWINKAKATLAELENDLNKATEALSTNNGEEGTRSESGISTPVVYTPTSSTAPSVINTGGQSVKVPIAARKSVRDDWEAGKPELEATISRKLCMSWTCPINYGTLWPYAEDGFAKQDPGKLITQYIDGFIYHLDLFIDKHGQNGIDELNRVAHTHTITIAHIDNNDPDMPHNGTDILDGVFRIVFKDGNLATNVSSASEDITGAINKAGLAQANAAPGGAPSALDFEDRSDIARHWNAVLPTLQAEFQTLLKAPVFTLSPNFEQNAAKLLSWEQAHPTGNSRSDRSDELRSDWRGHMGEYTMWYFEAAKSRLEDNNFGGDDLLQEGFRDVVDKNEIALRVVDELRKGPCCELVFENGVAIMQTTPGQWTVNPRYAFDDIVNML